MLTSILQPMVKPILSSVYGQTLWTPNLLSPVAWLDAKYGSFTDVGSGKVSSVVDVLNNDITWTQNTGSKRPTYNATGFNGQPSFEFDCPTGNGFTLESNLTQLTVGTMYFFVKNLAKDPLADNLLITSSTSFNTGGLYLLLGSSSLNNRFVMYYGTLNPAQVARYHNGTLITSTSNVIGNTENLLAHTFNGVSTESLPYQLGGNPAFSAGHFNGHVAKLLIFPTVHTLAQRQLVEGWGMHDLGIAIKLPADHPYKNSPPTT